MNCIPPAFSDFIALDCDRARFIQNFLNSNGIDCPIIQLDGKNHLYVKFPLEQYNPMFKIKTVIAHYDRVEGSFGANDNSAAVFCMLEWAVRLRKNPNFHNIRLVFTDGEEMGSGGIAQQGAYGLAKLFKKLGIVNDDIFVFDCMGRGNIPVVVATSLPKSVTKEFCKKYFDLEEKAEKLLLTANDGKWFKLPGYYSDNAGFIANGIPAVTITMLPSEEVDLFYKYLIAKKNPKELEKFYPNTWKMLHTTHDNLQNLTPEAFEITGKILDNLAVIKSLKN